MSRRGSVPQLVAEARTGDPRAVGRLISLVEDASPMLREAMAELMTSAGHAHVVGLTGPPGVGKSTTTSALVAELRRCGLRVGVLAVDPSSPFSGGALLGDRVRMEEHALDREVFIRSMASRGHLGGLSMAVPQAIRVLDAAGCDVVLLETVGVGQSEVEVAALADTTVVLVAPGMGDGIQAAKAGLLEVGDVYVVNKAEREGAAQLRRELRTMLGRAERAPEEWTPPVLMTVASRREGMDDLAETVLAHRDHLSAGPDLGRRRALRARQEIEALALAEHRARWRSRTQGDRVEELAAAVAEGECDPYSAVDRLLDR